MTNINFFGFITEHIHPEFPSLPVGSFPKGSYNAEIKAKVLSYLDGGDELWGPFMEMFKPLLQLNDVDDGYIYGSSYLTDGVWIWPSYITYYIEHFDFQLPGSFLEHMHTNNFVRSPGVSKERLKEMDNILTEMSKAYWSKNKPL